jgi:hypothetical protein
MNMTPSEKKYFRAAVLVAYKSAFKPIYMSCTKEYGIKTSVLRQMVLSILTKHITSNTVKALNEKTRTRSKHSITDPHDISDFNLTTVTNADKEANKEAMVELSRREETAEKAL